MLSVMFDAFAKLNLALDIVGEDGLGYHLLDGVMLRISAADRVRLTLTGGEEIIVRCGGPFAEGIPENSDNLAAKAARLFFRETRTFQTGLLVEIEKNIPAQAGLGGGSADAAAVLRGLNVLMEADLPNEALERMGLVLGADVPFCLRGGCVRAKGRGEKMSPLPMPPDCVFAVAKPAAGMDTKEAFSRYDSRISEPPRPDIPVMLRAVEQGDLAAIGRSMGNVFEHLGSPPEVAQIREIMREAGALGAVMTGSGSAVAGLFAKEAEALSCLKRLHQYPATFLARPME